MCTNNEWEDEQELDTYEALDTTLDVLEIADSVDPITALISPFIEDVGQFAEEITDI